MRLYMVHVRKMFVVAGRNERHDCFSSVMNLLGLDVTFVTLWTAPNGERGGARGMTASLLRGERMMMHVQYEIGS
jgi:hypothetical protein